KDRISQLYERHKVHPRGRNSERHPAPYNEARYDASPRDGALRNNHTQDPENFQDHSPRKADGGSRYLNDVSISDWKRNGRAESKPVYTTEKQSRPARHSGMEQQIKAPPVDKNRHWTEFERSHNAGTTHEQQAWDPSKRHIPHYERRGERGIDDSDRVKHVGK